MADATPEQRTRERRTTLLLTLGMLAGVAACVFVLVCYREELAVAGTLGYEEEYALVTLYDWFSNVAFIFPIGVWTAAVAITQMGRIRQDAAYWLLAVLFVFAMMWPIGARLAFVYLLHNRALLE